MPTTVSRLADYASALSRTTRVFPPPLSLETPLHSPGGSGVPLINHSLYMSQIILSPSNLDPVNACKTGTFDLIQTIAYSKAGWRTQSANRKHSGAEHEVEYPCSDVVFLSNAVAADVSC